MGFEAVLFDWRGTLVTTQSPREWISDGLQRLGRDDDAEDLLRRIDAADGPDHRLDTPGMDASRDVHMQIFFEVMADAHVDHALAAALYVSESDTTRNLWAVDAATTIRELNAHDVAVGVISDIHFDIRPAFAAAGLDDVIDGYSLSFEVGAQKPSALIYQHALNNLGVTASSTLMVGDRAIPDGGAVDHGLSVLLVPPLRDPTQRSLRCVRDLMLPHRR